MRLIARAQSCNLKFLFVTSAGETGDTFLIDGECREIDWRRIAHDRRADVSVVSWNELLYLEPRRCCRESF